MNKLIPIHLTDLNKNAGFTEFGIIVKNANDL